MLVFKQNFNDQELAMLFQAFSKKLFIRPVFGDIYSASLNSGCCFYFKAEYYENLKLDFQNARDLGKFAESNASGAWLELMSKFLSAQEIPLIDKGNLDDYVDKVGKYWSL